MPKQKQLRFGHGAEIVFEDAHMTGSGFQQSCGKLEGKSLTGSGLADEHLRFAGEDLKSKATKDIALVKAKVNVLKRNDGLARGGVHPGTWPGGRPRRQHTSLSL